MLWIDYNIFFNSDVFVPDGVVEITNKIKSSDLKKIVLVGNYSSGKTTILRYLEKEEKSKDHLYIYTMFDNFRYACTDVEIKRYYELVLSKYLINYIKKHFPEKYRYFEELDKVVNEKYNMFFDLIRTRIYIDDSKVGDLSFVVEEIIAKVKLYTGQEKIILMIDDFDHINDSSARIQKILEAIFVRFDGVIVTCEDDEVKLEERKKDLLEKGYNVINVDYFKNKELLRKILLANVKGLIFDGDSVDATSLKKWWYISSLINSDDFMELIIKNFDCYEDAFDFILNLISNYQDEKSIVQYLYKFSRENCAKKRLRTPKRFNL